MARDLRGDIQGLRAVAVLTVIAAHAGVPFLPGGFVGVDVFFVISGYLIASLLYREVLLTGRVSIGAFWARRARRILPAATLVTVVTVLLSLAWMSLLDARQVVIDALWASAFAANIHFAQQGVYYFAEGEGPSPLQHYWTLAVEEQFYVLWPLLLAACLAVTAWLRRGKDRRVERLPRSAVLTMLVALTLASLVWSVYATVESPSSAYFSTLTRAWELGVGAMVALVPPTFLRRLTRLSLETMAVTGAVMLMTACIVITSETPFPGIAAVLPVAGTAMLILSGTAASPGRRTRTSKVLAVAPMRIIGDWSYSLYLWHWPAFVLPVVALDRAMTPFEKCIAVLVVITLSAYTYRFVEMPFRAGRPAHKLVRRRALVLYPASALLVVTTAGAAWWWTGYQGGEHGDTPPITVADAPIDGSLHDNTEALVRASVTAAKDKRAVPSNLTPDLLNLRDSIADVGDCDYEGNVRTLCPHGDGDRSVVVIGDSHARAWIPAFSRIIDVGDWTAYYLVKPQCTAAHLTIASLESDEPFTDCTDFQDWVVDQVADAPPRPGGGRVVAPGQRRLRRRRPGHVGRGHHPAAARGLRRPVLRAQPVRRPGGAGPRRTQVARRPRHLPLLGQPQPGRLHVRAGRALDRAGRRGRRLGPRLGHRGRRPDTVALLPGRVPDRHRRHAQLPRHRPHHHRVRRQPLERARQRAAHAARDHRVSRSRTSSCLALVTVSLSQL